MVPVVVYDNGPNSFVEGRARTQVDGKIGYIDGKLPTVIPPRYDWGFPFEHGKAVVCSGCAPKLDGGEHRLVGKSVFIRPLPSVVPMPLGWETRD